MLVDRLTVVVQRGRFPATPGTPAPRAPLWSGRVAVDRPHPLGDQLVGERGRVGVAPRQQPARVPDPLLVVEDHPPPDRARPGHYPPAHGGHHRRRRRYRRHAITPNSAVALTAPAGTPSQASTRSERAVTTAFTAAVTTHSAMRIRRATMCRCSRRRTWTAPRLLPLCATCAQAAHGGCLPLGGERLSRRCRTLGRHAPSRRRPAPSASGPIRRPVAVAEGLRRARRLLHASAACRTRLGQLLVHPSEVDGRPARARAGARAAEPLQSGTRMRPQRLAVTATQVRMIRNGHLLNWARLGPTAPRAGGICHR